MKKTTIDGQDYWLPNSLNDFQQSMYVHLINWKWRHITREPGRDRGFLYDAILPESCVDQYPLLFPAIRTMLVQHQQKFPFRMHKYFNHMASSQAANINLFLPILNHPKADAVLRILKPDYARLATDQLDHGYCIEFWDKPYGNLNDKTRVSGTDADLAIAYYNHQGKLCLWLIEHKLTEDEFTTCGGFSSAYKLGRLDCFKPFSKILATKRLCYYHDVKKYRYWEITAVNREFFMNFNQLKHCPFSGGMNQLWRNQLLGLSIEQDRRQPYKQVTFSVVRHPHNSYLDRTLELYWYLIDHNPKFSVFTSADVIAAAATLHDFELGLWICWYRDLYAL